MDFQQLVSIGIVLLLVGGLSGVSVAERRTAADGVSTLSDDSGPNAFQQGGQTNLSEVNVSALEAVELVHNETDGKAVVVSLVTQNQTPAFNVTVLHENRSISQFTVSATDDPTITAVRHNITTVGTQFLGGEAFDFTELRTVAEAIQLVPNETAGTVVQAGIRRGELVYGVLLRTPEGAQTQVIVTATNESVLGIQTRNATTPTGNGS